MQPAITGIGQIHVSVSDIDRAISFYRDILGLRFLFRPPSQPMAFFDCGGVRLYLGVPSDPKYRANSFLYYRVDDIEAAYETLQARGLNFFSPPRLIHKTEAGALWMAGFQDPDGNYAQIMAEKPA
ncbi:VOC family protein [Amphiplicatus metriothermophilus]|uniref:Methylmalonyl-CoA epimerase n=1 Tax=Amphiplicatus metriothermophilus TaxID=1519374 RepID=A0A239PSW2_9PROT|nr:VOC family protein [Amphiplicatus metriothermophilus]MBB5519312.1 catechol 2,3-dioxygenase-like lactoylglutathione lyase family enzyme [Amphiplicatus metriothermophilus]SNT73381.1 methylmalonyl-CoA epimerase [Amphiplicatus metriothermophilus]